MHAFSPYGQDSRLREAVYAEHLLLHSSQVHERSAKPSGERFSEYSPLPKETSLLSGGTHSSCAPPTGTPRRILQKIRLSSYCSSKLGDWNISLEAETRWTAEAIESVKVPSFDKVGIRYLRKILNVHVPRRVSLFPKAKCTEEPATTGVTCPICAKSYTENKNMWRHMSRAHNVSEEELGALKRKGRQTSFTCDAHDTITEASTLECPVEGCSSRASKDSNLRRHLQQQHGYAHSCSECEEVFRIYRELKDHIAETHQETRVTAPSSRRCNVALV